MLTSRVPPYLLSLLLVPVGWTAAQQAVDLTDLAICERCQLVPNVLWRFGDSRGDGIIEGDAAQVRHDSGSRRFAVFHIGGSRILLFDTTGAFVTAIGRPGPGPGELAGIVDAQFLDSTLIVLDRDGPSLMVLSPAGTLIGEARISVRRGRFRTVSDSTVVIASADRTPAAAGNPLHVVRVRTGEALRHFGAGDRLAEARDQASNLRLGWSPSSSTIWQATAVPFRLEEWGLDGRLRRTVTASGRWFGEEATGGSDAAPPIRLETFGIDRHGRLWTISLIPDPEWRNAPRGGAEGFVLARDMNRFFDARIDIYDLAQRRHLGTLRWDEAYVGLVQIDGDLAVQRVVAEGESAQVVVYRLEPERR